ncbi:hypothetical protein SFUMM280S_03738 [Streptomyces fumanus]
MEEVSGGTWVRRASGSARRVCEPSGRVMSNLYSSPSPTPGTNSSHTPDEPSDRIGKPVPSQKLKPPATRTPRAFGAHTAKRVPVTPWWVIGCAPSACQSCSCRPSPIRYRSSSPSVGRKRYASSVSCTPPSYVTSSRYSGTSGSGSRAEKNPPPSSCSSVRSSSATTVTPSAYGRNARTATPPGTGCAPSTACGSWCVPASSMSRSTAGSAGETGSSTRCWAGMRCRRAGADADADAEADADADAWRGTVFLAGAFLAGVFLAAVFFVAAVFCVTAVFFAAAVFCVTAVFFAAVVFFAAAFSATGPPTATVFFAAAFFTAAAVSAVAVFFAAAVFFVAAVFFAAADAPAVVVFFVAAFFTAAVVSAVVVFVAAVFFTAAAFFAAAVVFFVAVAVFLAAAFFVAFAGGSSSAVCSAVFFGSGPLDGGRGVTGGAS